MAFRIQGRLVDNLPKIYGIYTGGFIVFILLMSILSKLGASSATIGILFVAFTICIYAIIGWLSRTMQLDAYYVAGREVPALYNGMATAADWMSGASFVALAGGVYFGGYVYMAFVVGWTGGYVLVNALMAPYLRKFGCYTVPDFIGTRYGGNTARFCAVIILVVASFTYVTAQINASGTIAARALQIPFSVGIWVGLVAILMCSMLGGMRAVTWTQVAQYIILIIAYMTPVIWLSPTAKRRSSSMRAPLAPAESFALPRTAASPSVPEISASPAVAGPATVPEKRADASASGRPISTTLSPEASASTFGASREPVTCAVIFAVPSARSVTSERSATLAATLMSIAGSERLPFSSAEALSFTSTRLSKRNP